MPEPKDFTEIRKQARLLLTLMIGLPEYQWFKEEDNKCILTPKMLPIWTSASQVLDELIHLVENPDQYE